MHVEDLGSRNGTKVNGERIQRTELRDGDVITIGTTIIKFVEAGAVSVRGEGRRRPFHRSVAWGVAIIVVLIGGFIAAWAAGLLGVDFDPGDLKQRLGLNGSDNADSNDAADGGAGGVRRVRSGRWEVRKERRRDYRVVLAGQVLSPTWR